MKRTIFAGMILIIPVVLLTQPSSAATPMGEARSAAANARNCLPTQAEPQEGTISPQGRTTGRSGEPLGEKLARSDGVICPPPGVDPEIKAPTPPDGDKAVISPPGGPDRDPAVRPK